MAVFAFTHDPAEFLRRARGYLAEEPVVTSVLATAAVEASAGTVPADAWWVTAQDDNGVVVGAAMRTPPYPPFLGPMPVTAAEELAREVRDRGEEVVGARGARPAVDAFVAACCRAVGGRPEVVVHTRLHELFRLVEPEPAPGSLRAADVGEIELVSRWYSAFGLEADEQAGRDSGHGDGYAGEVPDPAKVASRVRDGQARLWCTPAGEPVSLMVVRPPAGGVARIGPVYTPAEHRGQGYARSAVATGCRELLAAGVRPCLYTDQANPTSNRLYDDLGFLVVADQANLRIRRP